MDLGGKKIIVTGANGFLGRCMCEKLKNFGAELIEIDVKAGVGQISLDISNSAAIDEFLKGMGTIHGLVNNAAVSYKGRNTTEGQFDSTMDVNIKGTYMLTSKASAIMAAGGSIVNVASIYGMISPDFRIYDGNEEQYNSVIYGASKAAVIQMTKYFAVLFADKSIRINAVSPAGINGGQDEDFIRKYSNRVPANRMVEPEEVINTVAFLLSPLSSGINGANIPVTAGMDVW